MITPLKISGFYARIANIWFFFDKNCQQSILSARPEAQESIHLQAGQHIPRYHTYGRTPSPLCYHYRDMHQTFAILPFLKVCLKQEIAIELIPLQQLLPGRRHCHRLVCNDTEDRAGCTVAWNTQGKKKRKNVINVVQNSRSHANVVFVICSFRIVLPLGWEELSELQ